jgi:hypothetical protein
MPGSAARRSSPRSVYVRGRSSKSPEFHFYWPINALWSNERRPDPTEERDLESGIAFANYDELADRCLELLDDERARRNSANAATGSSPAQPGRRPAPRTVGKRRMRSGHSGSSN